MNISVELLSFFLHQLVITPLPIVVRICIAPGNLKASLLIIRPKICCLVILQVTGQAWLTYSLTVL